MVVEDCELTTVGGVRIAPFGAEVSLVQSTNVAEERDC
jgi:hypothetical protein